MGFFGPGAIGTATAADVLSGYTFSNSTQTGIAGTMPNQGSLNTANIGVYPAGYYSRITVPGWATLASDTTARGSLAAAYDSSANLTYAIDGNNAGYLSTVTAYSHSSNSWTAMASDTTARYCLAAAYDSSANLTYAIDGDSSSGYLSTVTAYSPTSNSWTAMASDTTGRIWLAAAYDSAQDMTYVIDGDVNGNGISTLTGYVY